ncbi:thioesterase II family protein [Amycolatopsis sp. EV170708-02-1]|uniref:thioesterase II family protein n=1 Tax=Amycolatopsis sp. EV170708-02-1 TaxID=2919322 RepID=UPI001F0B9CD9|nr:alpha/beta fold hydrolase [Amycolatopsis sp. EV170708-02-1]UMP06747.1 alpha/beta fold hydrolase [Amycolatopsis sp. EV170708-02-1]
MLDIQERHAPRWLMNRRRRPEAPLRLYCFAHSGGSIAEFVRWADDLPDIEVWGIQLPGRGSRISDPHYTRVDSLVHDLVEQAEFHGPFAFFGHSLGALLAYETARSLHRLGLPAPEYLMVSACPAPHLPRRLHPIHQLSDRELFAEIQGEYCTLPNEIAEDAELLAIVMSSHRCDFELVDSYQYVDGAPLNMPIHAVGGIEDRLTAMELAAWRDHCQGQFTLKLLPGGHFYLRQRSSGLFGLIQATLASRDLAASPADHVTPRL